MLFVVTPLLDSNWFSLHKPLKLDTVYIGPIYIYIKINAHMHAFCYKEIPCRSPLKGKASPHHKLLLNEKSWLKKLIWKRWNRNLSSQYSSQLTEIQIHCHIASWICRMLSKCIRNVWDPISAICCITITENDPLYSII